MPITTGPDAPGNEVDIIQAPFQVPMFNARRLPSEGEKTDAS